MSIKLLGGFEVSVDNQPVIDFRSDRERALLAYLVMESAQAHSRQSLMALLWPDHDPERARNNLRVSLHRLRKALEPLTGEAEWLTVSSQQVGIVSSASIEVDAQRFTHYLDHNPDPADDIDHFRHTVDLYRGDFLQGFDLDDSTSFADWILLKREWLHRLALQALHSLAEYDLRRGDLKQAQRAAQRQIELESWREEAHLQLMKTLALGGERSAALAQYRSLTTVLDSELGISPSPEATRLRDSIQALHDAPDPASIPGAATRFVGRSLEIDDLRDLLADPSVRLVSLVGPGGIGKSRLALELAGRLRTAYLHGVWWINLLVTADATLLPFLIADVLGIMSPSSGSPEAQLVDYLRKKEILLVLDNFEHLVENAAFLTTLIQQTSYLKIIVTSRERLMLSEEHTFTVSGLSNGVIQSAESDAVRLFAEAAQRVNPSFSIDHNTADVIALCQLVGGVPLAIELAASWAGTLPPSRIAAEIEHSPTFLAARSVGRPDRHASLGAVFEQTWVRLSPDEQQALADLTIFPESFDIDAAEAVVGINLDLLAGLVDKSLIQQRIDADGLAVYAFHPLIKDFAAGRLSDERHREMLDRHARFYLDLLVDQSQHLRSPGSPAALSVVHRMFPDVSLALENGTHLLDDDSAHAVLDVMMFYHEIYGRYREAEAQFGGLASALEQRSDLPHASTYARGFYGWYLLRRGRYDEAYAVGETTIREGMRQEDPRNMIIGHDICAIIRLNQNNLAEAERHFSTALAVALDSDDSWWSASLNHNLSRVMLLKGDMQQAEAYAEAGMRAYRQLGDAWGIGMGLNLMGDIKLQQEHWEQADRLFREQIALTLTIGHRRGIALGHTHLGDIARHHQNYETAYQEYRQALILSRDIGERRHVALNLVRLGAASLALGNVSEARISLREALELSIQIETSDVLLEAALVLIHLLVRLDDHQAACQLFAALPGHAEIPADLQQPYSETRDLIETPLDECQPADSLDKLILSLI